MCQEGSGKLSSFFKNINEDKIDYCWCHWIIENKSIIYVRVVILE